MIRRELKYEIDLYNNSSENLGYVSRNDTTYILLNLNNIECDIETIKLTILGKRSDGTLVEQIANEDIVKENETISMKLKKEFVNIEGIVNLNIKIEDKEGAITIIEPYFYVNRTSEGEIVEDENTIDTLEEIKEGFEELTKKVDDKLNEVPAGGGKGSTWKPNVSEDGILSWTEDNSDTPPTPINITGPEGKQGLQGIQGENGVTPHIGENGNWFIGTQDTGKPSRGEPGLLPQLEFYSMENYTITAYKFGKLVIFNFRNFIISLINVTSSVAYKSYYNIKLPDNFNLKSYAMGGTGYLLAQPKLSGLDSYLIKIACDGSRILKIMSERNADYVEINGQVIMFSE